MNAEGLLEHYNRIADAPDAIKKLRRFVLDLAVRGKLVEQNFEEESAEALLERISEARFLLQRSGRTRDRDTASVVGEADKPFAIPRSWQLVRFSRIADFSAGRTPSRNEMAFWNTGDYAWVSIADMEDGQLLTTTKESISTKAQVKVFGSEPEAPGTMLMSFKLTIGKIARLAIPAFHNEAIISIRPHLTELDAYLFLVLPQFARRGKSKDAIKGATLNRSSLSNILIPLPPLAEQHRIVAKVDELMALCDQLEAARAQREATRDRFAAASLARLNTPDPDTFPADARFALDALPALTTRPDQIKQLRQTILNLAVRGKLVPQDPEDEHSSALMAKISEKKVRQTKSGEVPKAKASVRDMSRLNNSLPVSWMPVALGEVCSLVTSGSRGWAEYYAATGAGFIRAQNIRFGVLNLGEMAHVNPPPNSEGGRTKVEKDDLLIVITGAGVTNPSLLEIELAETYVSQHVGLVRPTEKRLSRWLLLCLMADEGGRAELVERAYGAGKPGLNLDNIRSLSVPLPPLSEQHRIVAKVDELIVLCDQLEASLATVETTRSRLLNALLHEALTPAAKRISEHPRAAVSGYLISRLAPKRNFGRTAHMKHLYLAESRLGINLGGSYRREAAGPLDTGIYELEKQAETAGWYTHSIETLASGNEKVRYKAGIALKALTEEGIRVLGPSREEMDRLIDLMGDLKTEQVEIIATLFAAWNDSLLGGHAPDDDWIIKEVREHWHASKQRFAPADLHKWLAWMRLNDVVPLGHPPRTLHQTTMEL